MLPGSTIYWGSQNPDQSFSCDLVEFLEEENVAGCVNASEQKRDFGQCQAASEESKFRVSILEERQEASDVPYLVDFPLNEICLKLSTSKWSTEQDNALLLDES